MIKIDIVDTSKDSGSNGCLCDLCGKADENKLAFVDLPNCGACDNQSIFAVCINCINSIQKKLKKANN